MILLLFVYYKIIDSKISKNYINRINLKPSKRNLFESFYCKCCDNKITFKEINFICEYVDNENDLSILKDFSSPIFLAVILDFIINRIKDLIDPAKKEYINFYLLVISLLLCAYAIIWFVSTRKLRNRLIFKKALIYTKIKYGMKDSQSNFY